MSKYSNNLAIIDQLVAPTLALTTFGETVRQMNALMESMAQPMGLTQETMESAVLPLRIMQDSLNISLGPTLKMMNAVAEMAETNRRIFESVSLFSFNYIVGSAALGIIPEWFRNSQVIDGEIAKDERSLHRPLMQQVLASSQTRAVVRVAPSAPHYQTSSALGLKEISGRSFQYKRKTLKKLSYRNCEGRLLSLFLANQDLYVSDDDIRKKLHIPDGRGFSWVLRNLKRKLHANGLTGLIERRWDPDGYILIDIYYLQ